MKRYDRSIPARRTHHHRPPDCSNLCRGGANVPAGGGAIRMVPPEALAGEDIAARLEDFRRQMRDMHGLDMSRERRGDE